LFLFLLRLIVVPAAPEQMDPELKKSLAKLERFRIEWEGFVDGMIREWKTLNVVSALLLR
jgi:hypothetical protein